MKKILYCCTLSLCLLLFSGCGQKTLKCNLFNDYKGDITTDRTVIFTFKGDSLSKLSYITKASFSEDYVSAKDSLISSISDVPYKDFNGVSTSLKNEESSFEHKLNINYSKLSDDEKKQISIVNFEKNYEEIKNEFVQKGFTCE